MNNLQNSASSRSNISTNLSSRGKSPNQMKLQDLITMKIGAATPSQCTILTLTAVGHRRIGRRILGHLHKNDIRGLPTKDSINKIKVAAHQTAVMALVKVLTQPDLRIASTTEVKPTSAPKTTPSSWSRREKWSKTPQNLHSN
jgi:hypothetical protein